MIEFYLPAIQKPNLERLIHHAGKWLSSNSNADTRQNFIAAQELISRLAHEEQVQLMCLMYLGRDGLEGQTAGEVIESLKNLDRVHGSGVNADRW
ncbi:hypothetical protein ACFSQE_00960 [Vogesella fluminis]|uniref:Uncharacterized protein n=1 Tax=Vogesella fluminis TaxID=1069161 RepID=A0ABQ3HEF0_9NEIS|nr:hypothetical protein [Vogesella fluminis]GHD81244.1 hypothetical protein GCM10011419_26920 [Vogesella fluminis]